MRTLCILVGAALLAAAEVRAGSTEPELAIADASASLHDGVVTLEVLANFERDEVLRLGYPLAIVATSGNLRAELFLDGRVTFSSGGAAAVVPGAPGVVNIAPTRLTAVLPPALTAAGAATIRLEASYGNDALRSNAVHVQW